MATNQHNPAPLRWTSALGHLKAISIRQPWAWLVANGHKEIENRIWATHIRGPVLIHAGLSMSDFTVYELDSIKKEYRVKVPLKLHTGGIVGVAEIVDCVEKHRSKWFDGPYGWVLANARPLPFRSCLGKLKFFEPDFS